MRRPMNAEIQVRDEIFATKEKWKRLFWRGGGRGGRREGGGGSEEKLRVVDVLGLGGAECYPLRPGGR
jgi:hypothetical protein